MSSEPHQWVQMTIEDVDVVLDPSNNRDYFVVPKNDTPPDPAYGCDVCGEALTDETAAQNCPGAKK